MILQQENDGFSPISLVLETRRDVEIFRDIILRVKGCSDQEEEHEMAVRISDWLSNEAGFYVQQRKECEMITVTGWIDGQENPIRKGVYRTTVKDALMGWGYAFWSGKNWTKFRSWGNSTQRLDFVWCGLSGETTSEEFLVQERA